MQDEPKVLRAGVIGLGVGEQHVAGYSALPGVSVEAICDVDPGKLHDVGERRGITRRHEDWRRIVEDSDIDIVSICSYDQYHAEQVVAALENGKHVMCEKPICLHRNELEAVVRAQTDSGRLLSSNLILRTSPRFVRLKRLLDEGVFGDVFYMEGDYIHQILWKINEGWRGRQPFYCVLYGGGIHLIDLMRWLLGREVTEVAGMGSKQLTADSTFRYPDTTVNLLRFEGDTMAKSLTTFGPRRTHLHALNVYGTRRTFINDLPHAKVFSGDDAGDETTDETPYPAISKDGLLPDLVAAIRDGREPAVTARDVFRVMDVCFACWESIRSGRTVPVDYLV